MKWRHTTRQGTTINSKIITSPDNNDMNEDGEEPFTSSSSEGEDGEIDVVTDN